MYGWLSPRSLRRAPVKSVLLLSVCVSVGCFLLMSGHQSTAYLQKNSNSKLFHHSSQTTAKTPRICTHDERRAHIRSMCHQYPYPEANYGTLLTDSHRNLFYCQLPKAGCTTWKALWENSNLNKTHSLLTNSTAGVHSKLAEQAGIRTTSYKDAYVNNNYTKFIVVRNPYDRVLSAYYNLIIKTPDIPGPAGPVLDFLDQYNSQNGGFRNMTFPQFLEFLLDDSGQVPAYLQGNIHWKPVTNRCHLCYIDYNYVMRTETTSYDSGPVLSILGYPADFFAHHNFRLHSRSLEGSVSKELPEYRDIPYPLLDKFVHKYWYDLQLFGYGFNRTSFATVCRIQTSSGEMCC